MHYRQPLGMILLSAIATCGISSVNAQEASAADLLLTPPAQEVEPALTAEKDAPAMPTGAADVQAEVNVPPAEEPAPEGVTIIPAQAPLASTSAAAMLFEENGILTPKGSVQIEPSLQYSYSSSNRVSIVGYTVIPALMVGLLDVREVRRSTLTGAVTTRLGIGSRWDMEMRIPYVIRRDTTVSRQIGKGADADSAFNANGQGIGDVEFAGRYQLNDGGRDGLYLVGGLRLKLRNGKDPFEVVTDCNNVCDGSSSGLQLEQPTGSGFYSVQPSLTWILPSDPAVFFGGISYAYNVKRQSVSRRILNDQSEYIGDIEPGGILGVNFGMGLTLNEKSTFSIGFDLNSIGPTRINGEVPSDSVRTQLASLLLGYSYRYSRNRTVNVTVSAGLTRDTPDLVVNLKLPFAF